MRSTPFAILISLILDLALIPLSGLVFKSLWIWFAVPIFGLPAISIAGAIGVCMLASFPVYRSGVVHNPQDKQVSMLCEKLIFILTFWGLGWIVQYFGVTL